MSIILLRLIGFLLWGMVAIVLLPSVYRMVRGHHSPVGEYRVAFFFVALLYVGGFGRWLLTPDDVHSLYAMHALAVALAAYVLILVRQGRRQ